MYATEEEHESPYDQDHGYMYSLDAQVHIRREVKTILHKTYHFPQRAENSSK